LVLRQPVEVVSKRHLGKNPLDPEYSRGYCHSGSTALPPAFVDSTTDLAGTFEAADSGNSASTYHGGLDIGKECSPASTVMVALVGSTCDTV